MQDLYKTTYVRFLFFLTCGKFIRKAMEGKWGILTYHRVLPDEKINEDLDVGLAILASNFEKQIKLLKTNYDIVSIMFSLKNRLSSSYTNQLFCVVQNSNYIFV